MTTPDTRTVFCHDRNPRNRGFTCGLEVNHQDDHGVGRFPGAMRWPRQLTDYERGVEAGRDAAIREIAEAVAPLVRTHLSAIRIVLDHLGITDQVSAMTGEANGRWCMRGNGTVCPTHGVDHSRTDLERTSRV